VLLKTFSIYIENMGVFSVAFGTALGIGVKAYSNCLRKVALRREPWEYLVLGGLGMYAGSKYPAWQEDMVKKINVLHAERGLPPLDSVGQISITGKLKQAFKEDS